MVTGETEAPRAALGPTLWAVAAILAFWAGETLGQRLYFGPDAAFAVWGLQGVLSKTLVLLAGLLAGCLALRQVALFPVAICTVFGFGAVVNPLAWLWYAGLERELSQRDWYLAVGLQLLPGIVALALAMRRRGHRPPSWGLPVLGLLAAQWFVITVVPPEPLFYAEAAGDDYVDLDIEALYDAQGGLMQAQIDALAPQRPGVPETYALLLGGAAHQSVFRSEVEKAGPILDAALGSKGRRLALVNSDAGPFDYPMANRANLRRGLNALAERMGPEDLAFLYLTSHGGKDVLSLSFWRAQTRDLTAAEFAEMLEESGIGPVVIVLSACHSGSFLDEIAGPDRLVITAAAADRTSFGCADGRDWTEFGQSFFDRALRAEHDPRRAFALAIRDVANKELWGLRRPSRPQIAEGARIGAVLDRLLVEGGALAGSE